MKTYKNIVSLAFFVSFLIIPAIAQVHYSVSLGYGENNMKKEFSGIEGMDSFFGGTVYFNFQTLVNYQFNQWATISSGIGMSQNAYFGAPSIARFIDGSGMPFDSEWREDSQYDFLRTILLRIPLQVLIHPFGDKFGLFTGVGLHYDFRAYHTFNGNPEQPMELLNAKRNYPKHSLGYNAQLGYRIKKKPFRIDFGIQSALDAKPWFNERLVKLHFWQADYFVRFWIN